MNKNNILFLGSDIEAIKIVNILNKSNKFNIINLITKLNLKKKVNQKKIENFKNLLKTTSIINLSSEQEIINHIETNKLNYKLILCYSFGMIFSKEFVSKYKIINIHPSLLPKYRGTMPLEMTILNQDKLWGLTLFVINSKIDCGNIIFQKSFLLDRNNTTNVLKEKMLIFLKLNLEKILLNYMIDNKVIFKKNNTNNYPLTKKITPTKLKLDFHLTVEKMYSFLNAFGENYNPYFYYKNCRFIVYKIKIFKNREINTTNNSGEKHCIGKIVNFNKIGLFVYCKDGIIQIIDIQKENSKRMLISNFYNGMRNFFIINDTIN